MSSDWRFSFGWPLLTLVAATILTPWFGAEIVMPSALADPGEYAIFTRFRITRTGVAVLAGASLSVGGCLFQAVLRNPLASPYTLGVSSGAALGAVIAIVLNLAWVWTGSILGAIAALAVIMGTMLRQRSVTATSLILAGVSVNSVCSAMIILLQSSVGFSKSFSVTTWLIGAVEAIPPLSLLVYACICMPLMLWVIAKARDWDLLSLGEAWAAGRGVRVRSLLWQACIAGSLLTAVTVSFIGPVGFVGLMVPHLVRRFAGASHRRLLPACFFYGATFLLLCDTVARTVMRPAEVPVGVLTALLGGPGLIWILRSSKVE